MSEPGDNLLECTQMSLLIDAKTIFEKLLQPEGPGAYSTFGELFLYAEGWLKRFDWLMRHGVG